MSLTFDQIQPVVITAPTARNGITLLQRLLNSSRRIIVYGENKHFCETLPTLVQECQEIAHQYGQCQEATRRRFFQTTEFWSSALWPDADLYARQMEVAFREFVVLYQRCSEQYGFQRWGIKHPFTTVRDLDRFLTLLPSGRYIYIYRNLYDVARSAKARKFARTPQDFAILATHWKESVGALLNTTLENMLVIKYEEFVADPQPWLKRIEKHTGITRLNPRVLERRFNTFPGQPANGHSPSEYIAPEPLTMTETDILRQCTGNLLEKLGYHDEGSAVGNGSSMSAAAEEAAAAAPVASGA